jgi:hypothetical protein
LRNYLYDFNHQQIGKKEQLFLEDDLFKSAIIINERRMINYFSSKITTGCGFSTNEASFFYQSVTIKVNQPYNIQFALSNSFHKFKINNININGNLMSTLFNKARFKQKVTKKGWNEINILVKGTLFDKPIQKEKTFRYFVK